MLSRSLLLVACLALANPAFPQRAAAHYNVGDKGLAIEGYDPVAYWAEGGGSAIKGKKAFEVEFGGAGYRFSSESHRDLFLASPERYEPKYGGWCAWAMKLGDKVEVDPESFLIENETLLLFYDGWFNDTRSGWLEAGSAKVRPVADKNWKRMTGEGAKRMPAKPADALGGRDPVSYSVGSTPVKGVDSITTIVSGAQYRFASAANRVEFLRMPAMYAPSFGGLGARALATGKFERGDPAVFLKRDGALLLFVDASGRAAWEADSKSEAAAELAWTAHMAQKEQR